MELIKYLDEHINPSLCAWDKPKPLCLGLYLQWKWKLSIMEVIIMRDEVENVGRSEAQKRADDNYRKKHLDYITIRTKKSDRLRDLINYAGEQSNVSGNAYAINAIQSQLSRDGITIDMLPTTGKYTPPQPEPKSPKQYMIYMITEIWLEGTDSIEKYISTFPTLSMARKYVQAKLEKKAYPEDWKYIIRGRYVEADNKADALLKMRNAIKEALNQYEKIGRIGSVDKGKTIAVYIEALSEFSPTEYCEHITYDGNEFEYNEIKEDMDWIEDNSMDGEFEEIELTEAELAFFNDELEGDNND